MMKHLSQSCCWDHQDCRRLRLMALLAPSWLFQKIYLKNGSSTMTFMCLGVLKVGVNLLNWFTIPKNHQSYVGHLRIFHLGNSVHGPLPISIVWPRKVRHLLLNSHFCLFRVTPWDFGALYHALLECSQRLGMSSMWQGTPTIPPYLLLEVP